MGIDELGRRRIDGGGIVQTGVFGGNLTWTPRDVGIQIKLLLTPSKRPEEYLFEVLALLIIAGT